MTRVASIETSGSSWTEKWRRAGGQEKRGSIETHSNGNNYAAATASPPKRSQEEATDRWRPGQSERATDSETEMEIEECG